MKRVSVIFSSHFSDEKNNEFIEHLKQTAGIDIHVECIKNMNQYSLSNAYNIGWSNLDKLGFGTDIIIFCHNDIIIRTKNWGKIILNLFRNNSYDILGIAGSVSIYNGCWWLNENGNEMNVKNMYGSVYHTNGLREWLSFYNKCNGIKEVVVVDGLFIAVDGKSIINRFDERFDGFHFYDVSFCISNYLDGCDIGVFDRLNILHKSIGQTNQNWEENRKKLVEIYKDDLPLTINEKKT